MPSPVVDAPHVLRIREGPQVPAGKLFFTWNHCIHTDDCHRYLLLPSSSPALRDWDTLEQLAADSD